MMDKNREAFEAYIRRKRAYPTLEMEPEDSPCVGEYVDTYRQSEWEFWSDAWKESRKSIEVELPDKVFEEDEFDNGHNRAIEYCAEALTSLGIRVKGNEE